MPVIYGLGFRVRQSSYEALLGALTGLSGAIGHGRVPLTNSFWYDDHPHRSDALQQSISMMSRLDNGWTYRSAFRKPVLTPLSARRFTGDAPELLQTRPSSVNLVQDCQGGRTSLYVLIPCKQSNCIASRFE